jgi:cytochrome c5
MGIKTALLGCFVTCAVACAPKSTTTVTSPTVPTAVPVSPAAAPAALNATVELPDGPGKQILNRSCVSCHDLTEVTKFRGFYTRPQWRDIVQTMVDYGAAVNDKDAEVLTSYLTESLGKKP